MMKHKRLMSWLAAGVTAIVIVAISLSFSEAQEQSRDRSQQGTDQGFGGGFGGGRGGRGGGGGFGGNFPPGMFGGSAAVAAHGDFVFVVHNNTLYQFASKDLAAVNKVALEASPQAADARR